MLLNFHLIITSEREGKRERPTDKVRMRHQDESKVRKKSHNNLQTDVPSPLSSYPTMPSGHSAENLNTYIADRRQKLSRWGFISGRTGEKKKAQETQIKRRPEQEKKKTKKKRKVSPIPMPSWVKPTPSRATWVFSGNRFSGTERNRTQTTTRTRTMSQVPRIPNSIPH